ncbi:MAG TPA: PAS domain-containing protein [Anaerolineae bacterium]|nr:PAS domain-containing protein [Anaerolineae bacterium]
MPSNRSSDNLITRLLKPDPLREAFRVLADSLDQALLVLDADGKRILTCNHAFLLLTGYARADLQNLLPSALFPDEKGEQALQRLRETWQNQDCHLKDILLKGYEGNLIAVDLLAQPVTTGRALLLTIRPLSQRRLEETRLHAERIRLQALAKLSNMLEEGTITDLDRTLSQAAEMLGATHVALYRVSPTSPDYQLEGELPPEFPRTLPASELAPMGPSSSWSLGNRPDRVLQRAARVAKMELLRTASLGEPRAWVGILVACWKTKEQAPREAEALMNILANLCHATMQLNLQRQSIENLRSNIERIRNELTDQSSALTEALLVLDESMCVVRANPAAADMLGYRMDELTGLPVKDVLVGPEDALATLLDAVGHKRAAERQLITIHRRNGRPFPVQLRAVPTSAPAGNHLLVTLVDQSERQALVEQQETLTQRALLGEVTAIFAHEVRNPINNISMGVQLVASRLGKDSEHYASLDRLRKECTRLDQLLSDVLFFARPLELKMEPLRLSGLLQRLIARWKPRMELAKVQCHMSFAENLPMTAVDPRTFEQVIVNLISNALQAMPKGGSLTFSLAPLTTSQDSLVELKIADTGPGIPPDILGRIFDPFFTTKKEGTGLGLAITRRILTAHKGSIDVESYPGTGTIFTIRVPAVGVEKKG